ncbi:hypothetical protein Tco_0233119, partial [Tanacetum coccineum]
MWPFTQPNQPPNLPHLVSFVLSHQVSLIYAIVGCMDLLDDIFGASLNLEDTHLKDGFQEGYEAGFASGKDDGHEVGLKTGFITGEELGFYRGCIDVWNSDS